MYYSLFASEFMVHIIRLLVLLARPYTDNELGPLIYIEQSGET